jgi:hypothetical protein
MPYDILAMDSDELIQRHHHVSGLVVIGEKDRRHQRRLLDFGAIPLQFRCRERLHRNKICKLCILSTYAVHPVHARLVADGWDAPAPREYHGAWTFSFKAALDGHGRFLRRGGDAVGDVGRRQRRAV